MTVHQFTLPSRRNRSENAEKDTLSSLMDNPKQRFQSPNIHVKRRPKSTDVEMPDDFIAEKEKKSWNKGDQSMYLTFIRIKGVWQMLFQTITRKKLPCIGRQIDKFHTLPLHFRILAIAAFTLYKIVMTIIFVRMFFSVGSNVSELELLRKILHLNQGSTTQLTSSIKSNDIVSMEHPNSLNEGIPNTNSDLMKNINPAGNNVKVKGNSASRKEKSFRILYTIISSQNFQHDENDLKKTYVQEILIPTLKGSIYSMRSPPFKYEVDIHLILGWKLKDPFKKKIKAVLPSGTNLQIHDNIFIGNEGSTTKEIDVMNPFVINEYHAIIEEEIDNYDFFTVIDSSLVVTGDHISHYLEMTALVDNLKQDNSTLHEIFTGHEFPSDRTLDMTQVKNLIPGYIPVFVFSNENEKSPSVKKKEFEVDPNICCKFTESEKMLKSTTDSNNIFMQKVSSFKNFVNLVPNKNITSSRCILLDPQNSEDSKQTEISNSRRENPPFTNTGWMATQNQLQNWLLRDDCFNSQSYLSKNYTNGIESHIELINGNPPGCNFLPFLSLDSDHFSKHLILQTLNKDQTKLKNKELENMLIGTNIVYNQLNEEVQDAKKTIKDEMERNNVSKN